MSLIWRTELVAPALHNREEVVIVLSINICDSSVWHDSLKLDEALHPSAKADIQCRNELNLRRKQIHTECSGKTFLLLLDTLRYRRRLTLLVNDEYL